MGRWAPLAGMLALAVAACGSPEVPTVGDDTPDEDPPDGPPERDDDVEVAAECDDLEDRPYDPPAEEQPTPDPELTSAEAVPDLEPLDDAESGLDGDAAPDEPQHLGDQVREWAMREAPDHFGGNWLDPDHDGANVIGFTDDVDAYAEQVREQFGEGWWVVRTDNTWRELEETRDEIFEREMGDGGRTEDGEPEPGFIGSSGLRETISRVTLGIVEPDDDRLAELTERYGADRICFEIERAPTEQDAEPAPWEPTDADALSPDSTTIEILLVERACTGGRTAEDRLTDPDITFDDDTVIITPRVIPPAGPQDCPGNPETPATIELDEPLGDRDLLDGSHDPPRPPDLTGDR